MLAQVSIADFLPLADQPCALLLPDGAALPVQMLSTTEFPRARMKHAAPDRRTPFTVIFRSLQPSMSGCGNYGITLADGTRLDDVYVERIDGSDPALAYYQMAFN